MKKGSHSKMDPDFYMKQNLRDYMILLWKIREPGETWSNRCKHIFSTWSVVYYKVKEKCLLRELKDKLSEPWKEFILHICKDSTLKHLC